MSCIVFIRIQSGSRRCNSLNKEFLQIITAKIIMKQADKKFSILCKNSSGTYTQIFPTEVSVAEEDFFNIDIGQLLTKR